MPTTRVDPFRSYNFLAEIDGTAQAGFQACSGLDPTTSASAYREGKEAFHVRKLTGLNTFTPISLKRGVTESDELWQWRLTVVEGRAERRNGSIVLLDEKGVEKIRWNFSNAWPSKWTGPSFSSTGNTIAVE